MAVEGLLNRAEEIRDETKDGANTSQRVGGLMVDMVKSFGDKSLRILGHYDTLEELEMKFPDGSDENGMYAIGEKPYNYYAYYDGAWQDQGKLIESLSIYKTSLLLSTIVDGGNVTQEHLDEISAINAAWNEGKIVYTIDERGNEFNRGVLNIHFSDDASSCIFLSLNQARELCYFYCDPTLGTAGKWSVIPVGQDLYALIKHTHMASDVTEEADKKFVTGSEKTELANLATNYAKADLSNAMTVSLGQNGYVKFNNGLMIQWGYNTGSSTHTLTVYMPTSFYNSTYNVYGNVIKDSSDNNLYTFCPIASPSTSYFKVDRTVYSSSATGNSSAKFCWYAIGRWK